MFQPWPGGLNNATTPADAAELEQEQAPKQCSDNLIFGSLSTPEIELVTNSQANEDSSSTRENDGPAISSPTQESNNAEGDDTKNAGDDDQNQADGSSKNDDDREIEDIIGASIMMDHPESDREMEFGPMPEQSLPSASSFDHEEEYIIEKILDKRINSKGFVEFYVKWEGYPSSSNTWEPLSHLVDCEKAMQNFELERAKSLADTYGLEGSGRAPEKRGEARKTYEVRQIIGLTKVEQEKYFLVSFANDERPQFVRTTLANKMFPGLVIDFYLKQIRWKQRPETSS